MKTKKSSNIEKNIFYNIEDYKVNNEELFREKVNDIFGFLNIFLDQKSIEYKKILKKIAEKYKFDNAFIMTVEQNFKFGKIVYKYDKDNEKATINKVINFEDYKPFFDKLSKNHFIYFNDLETLKKAKEKHIKKYMKIVSNCKIKSALYFPIFNCKKEFKGVIGFSNKTAKINANKSELVFLNYLLNIIRMTIPLDAFENRYEAVFNNKQIGYALVDDKGKIVEVNKTILNMFGYEENDLVDTNYTNYIYGEELNRVISNFENRLEDNNVSDIYETKMLSKSGTIKDVKVTVKMFNFNKMRVVSVEDMTNQIKKEEKIIELSNRYTSLFKESLSIMLLFDEATCRIIDANRAALKFYNYDYDTITSMTMYDINILSKEELDKKRTRKKEMNNDYSNCTHITSNGEIKQVEVFSSSLNIKGKNCFYAIINDITEKKEVEKSLIVEQEFNKTLLNTANAMIITTDCDNNFVSINKYFKDLTSYTDKDLIGKNISTIIDEEIIIGKLSKVLKNDMTIKIKNMYKEIPIRTKNGKNKIIAWKSSLIDNEVYGTNILSVGIDITDKKIQENELMKKLKFEKSINNIRNIINDCSSLNLKEVTNIIVETVNVHKIEIIEFSNKVNGFNKKVFSYTNSKYKNKINKNNIAFNFLKKPIEDSINKNEILEISIENKNINCEILKGMQINNMKGLINIPFLFKEEVYGMINFIMFDLNENELTIDEKNYLKKVGDILKNHYEKKINYEKLQLTFNSAIRTLASIVEMNDAYTHSHQINVRDISVEIAKELKLSDEKIEIIKIAAQLHDIGKINIPGEILSKPGKINKAEFELIKMHSQYGYEILKNIDFDYPIAEIVLQHHEKIDGSGYPRGLKGDEICIEAKIITVADVVDAMTSRRPYRKGLGIKKALSEINKNSGKKYDKEIVEICKKIFFDSKLEIKSTTEIK